MLDTKIEILYGEVQEGEDEFIFDGFPDDSGHLIAIKFDDRIGDFDFRKLHEKYGSLIVWINKILKLIFLWITSNNIFSNKEVITSQTIDWL